jgi:hypothetical protein
MFRHYAVEGPGFLETLKDTGKMFRHYAVEGELGGPKLIP